MCLSRTLKKWLLMPLAAKYVWMPGRSYRGSVQLSAPEIALSANLKSHVEHLAGTIGERHPGKPGTLQASRDYINQCLRSFDYQVQEHQFPMQGEVGVNVLAELPGQTDEWFVVGGHYDTIPGSPGANDNGSGTAATIELARLLQGKKLRRGVRFLAFGNEEHVGQPSEAMGSYQYAASCRARKDKILGMWSLETLGYYSQDEGSQHYPSPFDLFYPTVGNFAAFVGNYNSKSLVQSCVGAMRGLSGFPCEGVASPEKYNDVNRSDHWGFWQAGYQALMVTDTANFRYRHYHTKDDTPDKIAYNELARLTNLLAQTLQLVVES